MSKWKPGDPTFADAYPVQSLEWHGFLNQGLLPSQISPRSGKRYWWRCAFRHEWKASAANRKNTGCPYCSGNKLMVAFNDLYTKRPDLAKEWHVTLNGALTPFDVMSSMAKMVFWLCPAGHDYPALISNRNTGYGCPYCSGNKVLLGFNDLPTKNPEVAQQWHPTKNKEKKPEHYTSGSAYRAWWLCEAGHEWDIEIYHRTGHAGEGRNCPKCSHGVSQEELEIFESMHEVHPTLQHHVSLPVPHNKGTRALVDMYLEANVLKIVVEYDGSYWHKEISCRDTAKTAALLEHGYYVLRLREEPLPKLPIIDKRYATLSFGSSLKKAQVGKQASVLLQQILS